MDRVLKFLVEAEAIFGTGAGKLALSLLRQFRPGLFAKLTPEQSASLDENLAKLIAEKVLVDAQIDSLTD